MTALIRPHHGVSPTIDPRAFVAETAAVIGAVTIAADASIWYGCVLRGDVNTITIGARTNVQDGTIIHCNRDRDGDGGMATRIGADITIGHMALLHACTLEDGCFIGMRSVVMDGAVVESGGMVAAGAVVTPHKVVREGELWAGMPAKMLRPLSAGELAGFKDQAEHYVELSKSYA